MAIAMLPLLIGSVFAQNPPVGTPTGRFSQWGGRGEPAIARYCDFPDEDAPRKPVRLTGLQFGYYPAFLCRGWYGAFPGPADEIDAHSVGFEVLGIPFNIGFSGAAQFNLQGGVFELAGVTEAGRAGFTARGLGVLLNSAGAVGGNEETTLVNVHLTFSVVSDPRGRLRIEAGLGYAISPQVTSPGLSLGLSGALGIGGPVGLELSAQVTPLPYREYDVREAVVITIGSVGLSIGWRTVYLDGLGLLDMVHDHGVFNGPFLGLSFRV